MERQFIRESIDFIIDTLKITAVVLVFNTFIASLCIVNGQSMYPTLKDKDILLIEKVYKSYSYGDIVVTNNHNELNKSLVKRVIGLPGDTITVSENGEIEVNGEVSIHNFESSYMGDIDYPYIVPENSLFLVGDNRNNSTDSRFSSIGSINKSDILGKVVVNLTSWR